MASEELSWIYIGTCEEEKYYIGHTDNPTKRLSDQITGKGSRWTKKYKIKEFRIFLGKRSDEDKYTIEYMAQYGIENVRGGTYSNIKLDDVQIEMATKQCATINDNCFLCNQPGHFVKNCKQRKLVSKKKVITISEEKCEKCGHTSHATDKCFAKRTKYGGTVGKKCDKCGRVGHTEDECYAKTKVKD